MRVLFGLMLIWGVANSVWAGNSRADFEVHPVNGEKVFKLSEAKGKYVALHFLLKTACPYCMRYTLEYARKAEEVPGVVHVFLKPDTEAEIAKWNTSLDKKNRAEGGSDLPLIYRDPEATLAKAFEIPFGYHFHGQEVHYPALVLLGPDGKEVFRYVGKNNSDRFFFDDFVKKMAEVRKKEKPAMED